MGRHTIEDKVKEEASCLVQTIGTFGGIALLSDFVFSFSFFFCSYIYCKTDFVLFVIVAFFTDTQTFTFLSQIESVQKH